MNGAIKLTVKLMDGNDVVADIESYSFEGGYLFYKTLDHKVHHIPMDTVENWSVGLDMCN